MRASLAAATVRLGRGATPSWTVLPKPRDVEFPERAPAALDITSQDSGGQEEVVAGLLPAVDWTVEFTHIPGSPVEALMIDLLARDPDTYQREDHLLELTVGGQVRTYLVYLSDYRIRKTVTNENRAVATWKITAEIAAPAAAPVNTVLPSIAGIVEVGETLTGRPGSYTNTPTAYSYQWQEEISALWTDIPGATALTLVVPGGATISRALRLGETASNAAGSVTVYSGPTVPVAA